MVISNVYSLPEVDFVGGTSIDLIFHVYYRREATDASRPYGLTDCTANFAIVNFVNKNSAPLVSKPMEVRMNEEGTFYNVLAVELRPEDTVDLFGKFIYQVSIKDIDNNADIPQQGIMYIHDNINKDFLRA